MLQPDQPFLGFEPLQSNYVYCPNQFFDVCMPHYSRGAVRIVAYLLRQTLGWLDEQGNPLQQEICVTYRDLIQKAGVSRGALALAIKEAVAGRFIECRQAGRSKSPGTSAQSAVYSLRWSTATECITDFKQFDGFFTGEGYRTPVPNSFFDVVVPRETLAVTRIVGTVLRHTIGYANQFGGRRSTAPLSHNYIEQYANVSRGKAVATAIRRATTAGYIQVVHAGTFSADEAKRSATTYAIRWLREATKSDNGSKGPAGTTDRSKKTSTNEPKSPAGDRSKKTSKETTHVNNTLKQQPAADFDRKETIQLLVSEGFDELTAMKLIGGRSDLEIRNQVAWIDVRNPKQNRVGMLRKAIAENWPKPDAIALREKREASRKRDEQANARQRQEDAATVRQKGERNRRRNRLIQEWNTSSITDRRHWLDEAGRHEPSSTIANVIHRQNPRTESPHVNVLNVIAEERGLPPVFQPLERRDQCE